LSRSESLECLVSSRRIVVPVRDLDRVVEVLLGPPPPLAEPWIAGLGLVENRPVVCLTLSGPPRDPLARCQGLLLKGPGSNQRYVLKVDEVRKVQEIEASGFEPVEVPGWPCPAGWLASRKAEGDVVPLLRLDTDAAAAALFGAHRTSPLVNAATS
jgi:hypothetical protein